MGDRVVGVRAIPQEVGELGVCVAVAGGGLVLRTPTHAYTPTYEPLPHPHPVCSYHPQDTTINPYGRMGLALFSTAISAGSTVLKGVPFTTACRFLFVCGGSWIGAGKGEGKARRAYY